MIFGGESVCSGWITGYSEITRSNRRSFAALRMTANSGRGRTHDKNGFALLHALNLRHRQAHDGAGAFAVFAVDEANLAAVGAGDLLGQG